MHLCYDIFHSFSHSCIYKCSYIVFKTLIKVSTVAAKTHVKEILVVSLYKICFIFILKIAWADSLFFTWTAGDAIAGPPKWAITNKKMVCFVFSRSFELWRRTFRDRILGIWVGRLLSYLQSPWRNDNGWREQLKRSHRISSCNAGVSSRKKISQIYLIKSKSSYIFLDVLSRATQECTHRHLTSLTGSTPICKLEP